MNQRRRIIDRALRLRGSEDREAPEWRNVLCVLWPLTETAESAERRAPVIENRGKTFARQVIETVIVTIGLAVAFAVAAHFSSHWGC